MHAYTFSYICQSSRHNVTKPKQLSASEFAGAELHLNVDWGATWISGPCTTVSTAVYPTPVRHTHVNFAILTATKWLLRRRSDKSERHNRVFRCRLWQEYDFLPSHVPLIPSFPAKDRPAEQA